MDFVLDNKISIDSLLTAILAIVFIIQTAYLARQTNVGVRINQSSLREKWLKEFDNVNFNLLIRKHEPIIPNEDEFRKLVRIFERMLPMFRSKLLKPADFAYFFIILDSDSSSEQLRKTKTYRDEYLTLQHIYSQFNKDYEMIDYQFEIPSKSWYDGVLQKAPILKSHRILRENAMNNWPKYQKAMKIGVILNAVILRRPIFTLKLPIENQS